MSDKQVSEKKSNSKLILIIVIALVLIGVGYFISLGPLELEEAEAPSDSTIAESTEDISDEEAIEQTAEALSETPIKEDVTVGPSSSAVYALSERIIGDIDAPIKISEHSSFTCGHCGKFHQETFGKFKKAYIDTGRVYVLFSDFPLNQPALHASMITRCAPKAQYTDFVQELFEEQEKWAYDSNYLVYLKDKAAKYGVDEAVFKACLDNKEISAGITERMKAAQAQWGITSTPSFVVNNKNVITGNLSFGDFVQKVEAAANSDATAPDVHTIQTNEPSAETSDFLEEPSVEPAANEEDAESSEAQSEEGASSEEDVQAEETEGGEQIGPADASDTEAEDSSEEDMTTEPGTEAEENTVPAE